MKKIIHLILILISNFVFSQCNNIIDLYTACTSISVDYAINGNYYKDLGNNLNPFEGDYLYVNGNNSLRFVLQKKMSTEHHGTDTYCEDMIVGGYKLVTNNVVILDGLNNVNFNYTNGSSHLINSGYITTGNSHGYDDRDENEKWLVCTIDDPNGAYYANLHMRKIIHNGQEALKIRIFSSGIVAREENSPPKPVRLLPWGEFILIKQ